MIRTQFLSIVLFEIWYRITIVVIAIPLLYRLFDWSMNKMGYSYITPQNIGEYFRNPPVAIGLCLLTAAAALLNLLEAAVLAEGFSYARRGISIRMVEMVLLGGIRTKAILRRYRGWIVLWSILWVLFVKFHVITIWMRSVPVANYLAEALYLKMGNWFVPMFFFLPVPFLGLLGAAFFAGCILEGQPGQKRGLSRLLFRLKTYGPCLLGMHLLTWAVLALGYLLVMAAALGVLFVFFSSDALLMRAYHLSVQIRYGIGVCGGMIGMVCNTGMLYSLYSGICPGTKEEEFREGGDLSRREDLTKKARVVTLQMVVAVIVVEGVLLVGMLQKSSVRVMDVTTITSVTAHRGGASYAPENTMAALKKSVEYGVGYAEIDVQLSQDGVAVLFHDTSARRIAGVKKNICDMTYEQLCQLDVGKYFRSEFEGERIPTLEEAIAYCSGKINLNIELKENRRFEKIADQVVSIIEKYNFAGQCVVTSMNYDYLRQVKAQNPDIRTGYIVKMAVGDLEAMEDVDFFSIKYSYATEEMMNAIHTSGKEVHVWTVNSRNAVRRMRAIYADNIITDDPTLVLQTLAEENHQTTAAELIELLWNR